MRRFSEIIEDLELRDFPLQGGSFTWRGGLNNQTQSRLDRFIVLEDWECYFSGAIQSLLPRIVSDHCPILLDCGGTRKGPSPFRFENMWLKEEKIQKLKNSFKVEAMSGLKVNLDKSEIIAVGRVENVEEVALEFGCKVSKIPFTYLGLPLGARFKEVATWDGVEERLRKRLSIWKMQYISKGGRMTLIRSTLSSMPIYCISLFQMPRSVSSRLERIQRDFLWGGGALERKPHLVEWSIICSDKRKGGLRVRSLALLNKALLCKWS